MTTDRELTATATTAGIASFLIVLASAGPILRSPTPRPTALRQTFAYLSLVPGAFTISAMTGFNWKNAIVAVPISLLIGTGLGIAQGWLARVLAAGNARAAPARALRLDGSPVADCIV